MDALITQTLNALTTLYHGSQYKEQASFFLTNLQNSAAAWELAIKLLSLNQSTESTYYGAQTLKHKIQNQYFELSLEHFNALKNSLYHYLFVYENSPIISNQLCLAIADSILLSSNDMEKEIFNLIEKLHEPNHSPLIFQIFVDIVEELQSRSLRLGSAKRDEISEKLTRLSVKVIQKMDSTIAILEKLDTESSSKLLCKIFKCLERWIEAHIIELDANLLNCHSFQLAMNMLNFDNIEKTPPKLHEKASDVFIATIIAIEEPSMYPELTKYLKDNILQFKTPYERCTQLEDNDDQYIEKSIDYCSLFTEFGNLCVTSIISNPNQGYGDIDIVNLLLLCVKSQNLEVAEITLNFWYNFAECLYNNTSVTKDDMKLVYFKPIVNTLLSYLYEKIVLEDDFEGIPNSRDDVGDFRCRIFELVQDMAFASDPLTITNQMLFNVKNIFANQSNFPSTWPTVEASLFLISALTKELIEKPNNDHIFIECCDILQTYMLPSPSAKDRLFQFPPALLYTCATLISEMSEWLANHQIQLETSLNLLTELILDPPFSSGSPTKPQINQETCQELKLAALKAISPLSEKVAQNPGTQDILISKYLPIFLAMAQNDENEKIRTPLDTLSTCKLNHSCRQELITIISILLPYLKDQNIITQCLSVICEKLIYGLLQDINSKSGDKDCDPTPWLDQISALFKPFTIYKSSTIPNILSPMLGKIWPILNQLFLSFQNSDAKTEKICRTIKHIFRAVGKDGSAFILPQLVETIVNLFQKNHHSSYLYLGSVVIEEFHNDPTYKSGLLNMFENFTLNTVYYLCENPNSPLQSLSVEQREAQKPNLYIEYWNSLEDPSTITPYLKYIPDTVEDFFRLCQKSVKYLTLPFLKSQYFPCVFKIFLATCFLDHREAHSAAMLFFCDMIASTSGDFTSDNSKETEEKKKLMKEFLNENGQKIMECLIRAVTFDLSTQLYPEVADVLYELMVYDKMKVSTWMEKALKNIQKSVEENKNEIVISNDIPTNHLTTSTPKVTDQAIHQLKLTVLNATQEKHISRAFREFALNFK